MLRLLKRGRNDPCWCGSGIKYKKCHLDREKEPKVNPYEVNKKATKEFRKKICLHPNASKENCDHIIKAHTINRGVALKSIAEDGHVYSCKYDFVHFNKYQEKVEPFRVGINEASIFTGFCAKHDNSTFEPIDQRNIPLTAETAFLLSYKSTMLLTYNQEAHRFFLEVSRIYDQGWSIRHQSSHQRVINNKLLNNEKNLEEIKRIVNTFNFILLNKSYEKFNYFVVRIDKQLPFTSCGGCFPDYDLEGNKLFEGRNGISKDNTLIAVNSINDDKGAIVTLGWVQSDPRHTSFANSFLKALKRKGTDFLLRFILTHSENTYFKISWWDNLDNQTRQILKQDISTHVKLKPEPWYVALAQTVNIGLPGNITKIVKKY